MSTSNSQQVTGTTLGTAQSVNWPLYYPDVAVSNWTNQPVYITTDGSAAVATGTNEDVVLPGTTAVFSNRLPLPNSDTPATDYSRSIGWTAQQAFSGANKTVVGLICATAPTSSNVLISPQ